VEILSRKLSALTAIIAMIVTLAAGFTAGVAWDIALMRGFAAFTLIMMISLVLFRLALKDRRDEKSEEE